jgi:hypothetical protein
LTVEHLDVVNDKYLIVPVDVYGFFDLFLEISNKSVFAEVKFVLFLLAYAVNEDDMVLNSNHFDVVAVLDVLDIVGDALIVLELLLIEDDLDLVHVYVQSILYIHFQHLDCIRFSNVEIEDRTVGCVKHLYLHVVRHHSVYNKVMISLCTDVDKLQQLWNVYMIYFGYFQM